MTRSNRSLFLKKLQTGETGYAHRDHRSPKGRKHRIGHIETLDYKRRKQELRIFGRYRKSRKGKI